MQKYAKEWEAHEIDSLEKDCNDKIEQLSKDKGEMAEALTICLEEIEKKVEDGL